jgi:transcriptional regulator with XRE-family HTH domain
MVTLEERLAHLTPERREKIEARTNELHRQYLALRKLREKLNLTQEEMARRTGIKQPAISKLENGDRRLTLDVLSAVISALGGEWELNVRLPDTELIRLTGSEEFTSDAHRSQKRKSYALEISSSAATASPTTRKKNDRKPAGKSK